jgi:hypothetical protein
MVRRGGSWRVKKNSVLACLVFLFLSGPKPVTSQESRPALLVEVILKTYGVSRTEALVYLRVFSDGSAEAHSMRDVDFRSLALKRVQISPSELTTLREFLSSSKVQHLDPKYERYWGNIDFGYEWQITVAANDQRKSIVLENFQPFLARTKKKPYPAELEKLGCLIWDLRTEVTGEPLEKDWVAGCRQLGY